MVGYAGSPTYNAYVDMTLTRSKVKVTGLLNFRQLAKPCMLAAMTAAPLRGFLVEFPSNLVCGRPRPHMRTSVTSTRSKVKEKVTELPKLRKVHFSRSPPPFRHGAQN